jgi:hypothetical protein
MDPLRVVTDQVPEPVALLYCTDKPARLTVVLPALNNSTKSFLKVEPELPPPP